MVAHLHYLSLWFCFTPAVTVKAMIYKLLSLNCFMIFALNALHWFHKTTVNHFFHSHKKTYVRRRLCLLPC